MLTLLLSRVILSIKFIRLLGIISLLFFFEYLTLLIHPTVAKLTHHTPLYEIIILVVLAAFIIPVHHKLEHWMIHKLLHRPVKKHKKKKQEEKDETKEA
ncbi:MAG: hypothetical protein IPL04_07700 [Chitinophagaceae bacterium]|nr:hypothetical protein [Chitinophagaceae bacterium]